VKPLARIAATVFFSALLFFFAATSCGGFQRSSGTSTPPEEIRARPVVFGTSLEHATPMRTRDAITAPLACGEVVFVGPFMATPEDSWIRVRAEFRATRFEQVCIQDSWVDAQGVVVEDWSGRWCSADAGGLTIAGFLHFAQPATGGRVATPLYLRLRAWPSLCRSSYVTLRRP
jgi:hypothetical protein